MVSKLLTFIMLLCLALLSPAAAISQSRPFSPGPEVLEKLGKAAKHYNIELSELVRLMDRLSNRELVRPSSKPLENPTVLRRIRGSSGIPFSSARTKPELASPPDDTDEINAKADLLNRSLENAQDQSGSMLDEREDEKETLEWSSKAPEIPSCRGASTRENQMREQRTREGDQLVRDILFVAADQRMPDNAQKALGTRTEILVYDRENNGFGTFAAMGLPIECLPTRIRITGNSVYVDQGLNALKNYDADQRGQGVLDLSLKDLASGY